MTKSIEARTVLIDLDSTLVDFEGPIRRALAERGIAYADPSLDFYADKRYDDPEVVALIKSVQNSQGFFRNLEPLHGAVEIWAHLQENGFHPRICSKPLRSNPWCVEEKLAAVDHYFGPHAADDAYIGRDKESEAGIALIDDRPELTDGMYWRRVIYTQPWNAHEEGLRIESWSDPQLLPILAQCADRYDSLFGH